MFSRAGAGLVGEAGRVVIRALNLLLKEISPSANWERRVCPSAAAEAAPASPPTT